MRKSRTKGETKKGKIEGETNPKDFSIHVSKKVTDRRNVTERSKKLALLMTS